MKMLEFGLEQVSLTRVPGANQKEVVYGRSYIALMAQHAGATAQLVAIIQSEGDIQPESV